MKAACLLAASALTLSACEQGLPEVTPEEGEKVAQIAAPAVAELLRTLVGRITGALEEGGLSQALELCSTEAIPLTRMVEAGLGGSLSLKRTSFRYRNPDNAPDEGDEAALLFFERAIQEQGQAPASFVQRASLGEVRYYRPLFVGEVCLGCHGDAEFFDPQLLRVLSERYPEDLATGYEAGAFRGLVRVSMPVSMVDSGGL
ncbi:MAG: DUF3365 domain-containing protein [Gemmatimonadota bacterium]